MENSQPMGGEGATGYSPNMSFTPREYDSALVHLARAKSLEAITYARLAPDGQLVAWEGTLSFAETLLPLATIEFLRQYQAIRSRRAGKCRPARELWRACCMEMKRQKRLGDEAVPIDRENFGVE